MSALRTVVAAAAIVSFLLRRLLSPALLQRIGISLGTQAAHDTNLATAFQQDFLGPLTTCKEPPSDFSGCLHLPGMIFLFHTFPSHLEGKELPTSAQNAQEGP